MPRMVPRAGLEPAQAIARRILSPLRLPNSAISAHKTKLEAAPGIEPGIRVLQTRALPLGYAAASSSSKPFSCIIANKSFASITESSCSSGFSILCSK